MVARYVRLRAAAAGLGMRGGAVAAQMATRVGARISVGAVDVDGEGLGGGAGGESLVRVRLATPVERLAQRLRAREHQLSMSDSLPFTAAPL